MANVCGQCEIRFDTLDDYLEHNCPKTEYTPKDPEHLGPHFANVSKKALERGESRKKEAKKKV